MKLLFLTLFFANVYAQSSAGSDIEDGYNDFINQLKDKFGDDSSLSELLGGSGSSATLDDVSSEAFETMLDYVKSEIKDDPALTALFDPEDGELTKEEFMKIMQKAFTDASFSASYDFDFPSLSGSDDSGSEVGSDSASSENGSDSDSRGADNPDGSDSATTAMVSVAAVAASAVLAFAM